MGSKDWLELQQLVRSAEAAIMSGTLNDWQHANTSTFHVLANALLDLNNRLARFETASDQSLDTTIYVVE
jgi:hypothetical protein